MKRFFVYAPDFKKVLNRGETYWEVSLHAIGEILARNEEHAIEVAKRQGFRCPIVEAE